MQKMYRGESQKDALRARIKGRIYHGKWPKEGMEEDKEKKKKKREIEKGKEGNRRRKQSEIEKKKSSVLVPC